MSSTNDTAKTILGLTDEYIVDSNHAVQFKLVRQPDDIRNDKIIFNPDMSYQIFGDEEKIYGYKNLKIKLYYTAAQLNIYLGVEYDERLSVASPACIEQTLATHYQINYLTNLNEFEKVVTEDESSFSPLGTLLTSFKVDKEDNSSRTFEIYLCSGETQDFIPYHARMQTFILWFIDAASYVDIEDLNWKFFVVLEKYASSCGNKTMYSLVGYASVYEYYAYPANLRPRISQVLILPLFQGMGICAKLVGTIHNYFASLKTVLDITVEDPSENFQRVRDYVDCCNCSKLASFAPEKLKEGFNDDMANEAREKYRINKKQVRRVYEILRLRSTNVHDSEEFTDYRLDIKKRLNSPFVKQMKLLKRCNPNDLPEKIDDDDERKAKLQSMFEEIVSQYNKVIGRMSNDPLTD